MGATWCRRAVSDATSWQYRPKQEARKGFPLAQHICAAAALDCPRQSPQTHLRIRERRRCHGMGSQADWPGPPPPGITIQSADARPRAHGPQPEVWMDQDVAGGFGALAAQKHSNDEDAIRPTCEQPKHPLTSGSTKMVKVRAGMTAICVKPSNYRTKVANGGALLIWGLLSATPFPWKLPNHKGWPPKTHKLWIWTT